MVEHGKPLPDFRTDERQDGNELRASGLGLLMKTPTPFVEGGTEIGRPQARDLAGNTMPEPYRWDFATGP